MLDNDNSLNLQGVYNSLYNATTRPDFKFAVTRYFIDEWVPLLGPSLAWLVVGLRQQCFWNQRRNWCIVDKATLAGETGMDKRTIERILKKPVSRWFVLDVTQRYRYRHQIGKKVRDKNRYQLLLDEPLSPRHQYGLSRLLDSMVDAQAEPLSAALAAAQTLTTTPHLNDKISCTDPLPPDLTRQTILDLVAQTFALDLTAHAHDERLATLDHYCAKLHNQIVQPNKIYVGWQYYRFNWVPLLGHALAWMVIYLRRNCYWDETNGELRDTYSVYKKDLATAIGQTTRNLANLTDNPHASLFFTTPEPDEARNKPTLYRVRMVDDPLTPADQQKVAIDLRQQLEGSTYGQDPENGQLNLFPMFARLSTRQNFAYGQLSEETPLTDPQKSRFDAGTPEILPQYIAPVSGNNVATKHNDSLIPPKSFKLPKQQDNAAVQSNAIVTLLNDLAIQEPARSQLLANPDVTAAKVGAWYLYAETQPNLFDPRSYVIKRLLANDAPPPTFLAFARLTDATWQLFEATVEALHSGAVPPAEIPVALMPVFLDWAEVYAGLPPDETPRLLKAAQLAPDRPQLAAASLLPGFEAAESDTDRDEGRRLWQAALAQLQLQMARQTFDTWLRPAELVAYQDDQFVVNAKNTYAKEWLENRLTRSIERVLSGVVGRPVTVRFILPEPQPVNSR
jgi:hypothetical protein